MHPSEEHFTFQQCDDCSLVFLNPRVPLEKLKNYYTDFYLPYRGAAAWGKYKNRVEASQQALDKKRASWVGQFYDVTKDTVILDVGCGKPTFLKSCFQEYHCKTIGIDFTDEGWKGQAEAYEGVELRVGEVEQLTKEIQPNVITMWHYLEHDYDPLSTLKKLRDIAQPDTKLLIEVPNYDSESRRKYGAHWAGYHTPRHTFLFSPNNLNRLLERAGWQTKKINTYGTLDPYVLYWMSEMEQKNIAWDKNMGSEFFNYVRGLIAFLPKRINGKQRSLGIMTAIAGLK
jgi:2-polyprenyl-3-methyl-5-hydroxy-6-metoxy-1,4-benzoquinol methylase